MDIVFAVFVFTFLFILGAIVGSFLNVVIFRYNTGVSVWKGRSMCPACGKKLAWYELIPLVSFVIQRGKCRGCRSKVSWQYPAVEATTGALFLLAYCTVPIMVVADALWLLYLWVMISIFMVITVYDIKHKIIPDGFVYTFIALSILAVWRSGFPLWDVLAGPILFTPFALLWYLSGGRWMGFGDAKLAWGMGWFLGLWGGVSAIILAFWGGAIAGLFLIAAGNIGGLLKGAKKFTIKSEIPFGPFLVLGTLLVLLFNVDVFSLLL